MAPSVNPTEEARETNSSPQPGSGILTHDRTADSGTWSPATVLNTLPKTEIPLPHSDSPLPFLQLLYRLKSTKREGWRRFGIKHGESIADHMYRMSIITMLAPSSLSSRLDVPRCTKMALIHDMAESLVGDITPADGVLKVEKNRREAATMDYLCFDLLGKFESGEKGRDLRAIWQEYEDNETFEAKFVHDVDKIELILQMLDYEKSHEGRIDLGEFSWVAKRIVLPEVNAWCEQLLREREDYWRDLGKEASGTAFTTEREKLQEEYYGNGVQPPVHEQNA